MATKTEVKSSYLEELIESEKYQSQIQSIQDWLTGQTKTAQQQYQAASQTAAQQASYDISGAYANYLKQQRAIASQGQLETGHKEEVGEILGQQYGTAYQQARTTQAKTTASAAEAYSKNISSYTESAEKAVSQIYEAAEKEAQLQANIYKFAEQELGDIDKDYLYTTGKQPGDVELTSYGVEQFRKYLLQDESFKQRLEEEELTEELEYYLSNSQKLHQQLFGFEEDVYNPQSTESVLARMSRGDKYTQETFDKVMDITGNSMVFGNQVDYKKYFDVYRDEYGLTDDDIKKVLLGRTLLSKAERDKITLEDALELDLNMRAKAGEKLTTSVADYHTMFVKAAEKKYKK